MIEIPSNPTQYLLPIEDHKEVDENIKLMTLCIPPDKKFHPQPGQFCHVNCGDFTLRRPLSIHQFHTKDGKPGQLELLYQVHGRGTQKLALLKPGRSLDIIAPLGHGFTIRDERAAVLVAGGIGIAPLSFLAGRLRQLGKEVHVYWGLATSSNLLSTIGRKIEQTGAKLHVSTVDGLRGKKGLITDLLAKDFGNFAADTPVYTCGPRIMMQKVAKIAEGRYSEVSLEERTACGVGACLGCTCSVQELDGTVGKRQVCLDGPVFKAESVVW